MFSVQHVHCELLYDDDDDDDDDDGWRMMMMMMIASIIYLATLTQHHTGPDIAL